MEPFFVEQKLKFIICFTVGMPSCSEVSAVKVFHCPEVHRDQERAACAGPQQSVYCERQTQANTAVCALVRHQPNISSAPKYLLSD